MPQIVHAKSRRRFLIGGAGVFALIGLGYLAWCLLLNGPAVAARAQAMTAEGRFADAERLLGPANRRAFLYSDKLAITSARAANFASQGNLRRALTSWQMLDRLEPGNYGTKTNLAQTAERLGDKALALRYYREALPLAEALTGSPNKQATVSNVKAKIAALEADSK